MYAHALLALGNSYEITVGDVQVMSTGSGLRHAEFNRGAGPLKIFQIWLSPNQLGGAPAYAARRFPGDDRSNQLVVFASGLRQDDATDVLPLRADARLLAGRLQAGRPSAMRLASATTYISCHRPEPFALA